MKKLHWYYKFLIIFLIFFSLFFMLNKNMSKIVNSNPYKSYINFISIPFNFIDKYNIFRYKQILNENNQLKKQIIITTTTDYNKNSLIKEINTLKKELKLKNTYTKENIQISKTITRNKMYWFNTITIDKGLDNNITTGNAVITENGLIGTVEFSNKTTSTIKLITNNDTENKISVTIKNKNQSGTIIGYQHPYILVELIENNQKIEKEDQVVTSGLGNLPKDIYIGTVEKLKKDNYKISNIIYVKPKQNMNNITYVGVLTDK